MIKVRRSNERGHVDHGWLDTRHTFSFAEYFDPEFMGFRALRVINEDRVEPGEGFPSHGHKDMEIITYVLEGALQHKDSMGNGSIIRPGDFQRMSAGRGVLHSEYNHSKTEKLHLLQIWILPEKEGREPGYEQKSFTDSERKNRFRLVASREGDSGALSLGQDVRLFSGLVGAKSEILVEIDGQRHAWVQVVRGSIELNGHKLLAGDGAAVSGEKKLSFLGLEEGEVLLFDLA
jgi:quercetin 2,3-dioxygenase